MPTARQRATHRLVQTIRQHRHPSHQLLDRLEGSLRTREDLDAYSLILFELTGGQRYPSLRVLDRLDRCALAHELSAPREDDDKDDA
ncbi:MAG TPA: hypothetical protein VHF25_04300 [Nitriliruptorales bacterium]|nr:hypothetical protein [Nitriliruptorales bacterium]